MIFLAIDLDNENHAKKPSMQAKFVIHKSYDLEYNEGKAEVAGPVISIDKHINSDGFVFSKKTVKRFTTKVGEKRTFVVDVDFKFLN